MSVAVHVVRVSIDIAAPLERCFDLARDVEAHVQSAAATGERVVDGKRTGLLELGDTITFEARHLGFRRRLSAVISAFDRPTFFQDRMTAGAFKSLEHDHHFTANADGSTHMVDNVRFQVPCGWPGRLVGRWIVAPHLQKFLIQRGQVLKTMAEA
ncbi:MAG: cell division protein [Phycisphaerales bacterium]|nr:cell division protein [Phycisphaerales bacterium]